MNEPAFSKEHLTALADGMNAVDRAVRALIADELSAMIPGYEAAVEKAAARLREAVSALEGPESALADLDEEIVKAEAKFSTWQAQLSSDKISERVSAKTWLASWQEELAALREKKAQHEDEMQPLVAARNKAKDALARAQDELNGLKMNAAQELAYVGHGQQTKTYQSFRFGLVLPAALNPDHPEHDKAMGMLREYALMSGFRTCRQCGGDEDLPDPRKLRNLVMADRFAEPPEKAPSAQEVLAQDQVSAVNAGLQKIRSRVDDFRGPAVPRETPARDYMKVPKVSTMISR